MLRYKLFKSLILMVCIITSLSCFANTEQTNISLIKKKLAALEARSNGRIGLYLINTADNSRLEYRATEPFPLCSTGKVIAVSAILKESIRNSNLLQQKLRYTSKEVEDSGYAPITKDYVIKGMTIDKLCQAALIYSDNTAMNVLMRALGGPKAITLFARSIGDHSFRLDRYEPDLNSAIPGDLRDTTTPKEMAESLHKLAFGTILESSQKNQLISWLKANTTGNNRIRAAVPKDWLVGDKTGTGSYGTTNDVAIIWPPKAAPIIMAIYFTQSNKDTPPKDDVIKSITHILVKEYIS